MRELSIQTIVNMLVMSLRDRSDLTAETIHEKVYDPLTEMIAAANGAPNLTADELIRIQHELEAQLIHRRTLVNHVIAQPFTPWLKEARVAGIAKNWFIEVFSGGFPSRRVMNSDPWGSRYRFAECA